MHARKNWWLVAVFALAMAWMEAATVVYLRVLVGHLDPYQAEPLPDLDLPQQIMRRQGDPTSRLPQAQPPGDKKRQPDDRLGRRGARDVESG
jgi:hypothetical protein